MQPEDASLTPSVSLQSSALLRLARPGPQRRVFGRAEKKAPALEPASLSVHTAFLQDAPARHPLPTH